MCGLTSLWIVWGLAVSMAIVWSTKRYHGHVRHKSEVWQAVEVVVHVLAQQLQNEIIQEDLFISRLRLKP
jgi:hypothetical protein